MAISLEPVDWEGDIIAGVSEVDVFDTAREGAVFSVIVVEFGEFLLVGGFEMSLPVADFRAPDDFGVVLCV